jgi:uncharacterized membrane protein
MSFGAPEWFFLLPALVVVAWRWRRLRLHEPLRAFLLAGLVLALSGPRIKLAGAGLDLWVLADRSESAAGAMARQEQEIDSILQKSRGREDRVIYVDFAGEAVRRDVGDPVFEGALHQTRLGSALDYTLAQMPEGRAARILVLSDGYATEPLGTAADALLRSRVPLDFRLLTEPAVADWRVSTMELPPRVLSGEAFLIEFGVTGSGNAEIPWELYRGGALAASGTAAARSGGAHVRLTDRLTGSGAVRYEVRIRPSEDAHPENNTAGGWSEIAGGPRVMLVTNYADDPLSSLLGSQGLAVEVVTDPAGLTPASLTGARAVVLNNVPANRVNREFLGALDFFVREQGGGLLMVGGQNSFGAGGYFSSAIDELLPVSMELRKDQRKFATAMAIVMDRSGSMGASVGNGQTKMDLADAGAARAVELLGEMDAVAIFAVDRVAHPIIELSQVGPNRESIISAVKQVNTGGGGHVVPLGLQAGWDELRKAQTGVRHIILFGDANDSRQAVDGYDAVAELIKKEGGTISVIGLGSEMDRDADILKDVAKLGGGRVFFTTDATELPALFAQETVSVARSAFITAATGTKGTPGWSEIAAKEPDWLRLVDGYNLSYLRDGATQGLMTTDEYAAPLVATWQRGAGRAAAVSFPLGGNFSKMIRDWPGYGDFVQTIGRWLAGDDTPPGLALRAEIDGERATLDLLYDESWQARIAASPPTALLAESGGLTVAVTRRPLIWEKIEPGRFRATTALVPGKVARGAVRIGNVALPFGPLSVVGSAEWAFERGRLEELTALSARSGGREQTNLADVWKSPRPIAWRSIRVWVVSTLLGVLLADALLTRIGVSLIPRRSPS